jgi:succinate dehydrogenase/fumarate reductase flavoprotein subunit
MNPPAIEIYAENDIDLTAEPLEIAVCAQHHNGGFAVNAWWESNIAHTFVIGEMAGTHGVKRPGGSALNAGQAGALRAAQYIANVYGADDPDLDDRSGQIEQLLGQAIDRLDGLAGGDASASQTPDAALAEIGQRMTRYGAHLRSGEGSRQALDAAIEQIARIDREGLKIQAPGDLAAAVSVRQQAITHAAMLAAIRAMFDLDVGSRGSHCILDPDGIEMHPNLIDPQTEAPYRFKLENQALRETILHVSYDPAGQAPDLFPTHTEAPRPIPDRDVAFEPAWAQYRQGQVYHLTSEPLE